MNLILIPDADDPESANWYVDGMVGDRTYRFLLDTGAGTTTMISDDYLSKFQTVGSKSSAGAFAKTRYDLITVPILRVEPLSKTDMTIARASNNGTKLKNVLGMNFFSDSAYHFKLKSNELQRIGDAEIPGTLGLNDLFLGENYHPYVEMAWEGDVSAKGVWDTGAGTTVFDLAFIKKHPQLFRRVGISIGTDSTGASNETPVYLMKAFMLGGQQFPETRVAAVDLSVPNSTIKTPMDFILGFNVLSEANWIFDFKRRKWAISEMLR